MPTNEMQGYGEFTRTAEQNDPELLYSEHGALKKGGFLAPGQGVLPTGQVLSYDEATGLWIKYDNVADVNEVQTLTVGATSGQYRLTYKGAQTGDLEFDDDAATIDAALEALSTIGAGEVAVGGTGPWTITFSGTQGGQDVPLLTVQPGTTPYAGGTVVVAQTTQGVRGGQKAEAILGHGVDTGASGATDLSKCPCNVYFGGRFKTAVLVGMDASAKTDLGAIENIAYGWTSIPA